MSKRYEVYVVYSNFCWDIEWEVDSVWNSRELAEIRKDSICSKKNYTSEIGIFWINNDEPKGDEIV